LKEPSAVAAEPNQYGAVNQRRMIPMAEIPEKHRKYSLLSQCYRALALSSNSLGNARKTNHHIADIIINGRGNHRSRAQIAAKLRKEASRELLVKKELRHQVRGAYITAADAIEHGHQINNSVTFAVRKK